ncbi:MAG: transcriptional repressor [Chloroflexi bacterium]|nr:MAG: hypothetical protein B6I35_08775 [Anaerolineaceae bacterium 4572_32.2]RLC73113.1 MAG: transcriptional repressor [Chloroflexota bacterium]RLC76033.1 MAG: transcriptional repressor [Chloroflexota bacterium]HEY73434.1 transcriptional repressor [Thermoflexia bacterium]
MDETRDHLRDTFRAAGRRLTSQRRLILDLLQESDEHLDAEMVYDRARARDAGISLATVYRALAVLKEMGLVEEHRLGEEHCHYEAVGDGPHYHFSCLGCGKVIEFDTPLVAQIQRELSERDGVSIIGTHLHLSGYCAECQ